MNIMVSMELRAMMQATSYSLSVIKMEDGSSRAVHLNCDGECHRNWNQQCKPSFKHGLCNDFLKEQACHGMKRSLRYQFMQCLAS